MLRLFASECDGHLEILFTVRPSSYLALLNRRPMYSVQYSAGPELCAFEKSAIGNMSVVHVIEPVQTE